MKHAFFAILFLLCTAASSGLNASGHSISDERIKNFRELSKKLLEKIRKHQDASEEKERTAPVVLEDTSPAEAKRDKLTTYSNSTDNTVLRDAFGFILNGDDGWSGSIYDGFEWYADSKSRYMDSGKLIGYDIKDCVIKYGYETVSADFDQPVIMQREVDLNWFNWKTYQQTYYVKDKITIFEFDCVGVCNKKFVTPPATRSENWEFFGVVERLKRSRFEAAMRDIAKECPGARTKY